jgi:hypothetical protein
MTNRQFFLTLVLAICLFTVLLGVFTSGSLYQKLCLLFGRQLDALLGALVLFSVLTIVDLSGQFGKTLNRIWNTTFFFGLLVLGTFLLSKFHQSESTNHPTVFAMTSFIMIGFTLTSVIGVFGYLIKVKRASIWLSGVLISLVLLVSGAVMGFIIKPNQPITSDRLGSNSTKLPRN